MPSRGDGHKVTVDGFSLTKRDGSPVCLSDDWPINDRVFYFRVAGVMHHQAGAQSPAFAQPSQVVLVPEPTNPNDPNAIRVTGHDGFFAGYVPRTIAAVMCGLLGQGGRVCAGLVTRTYATSQGRNAIEVLAACDRDIDAREPLGEHAHDEPSS